MTNRCTESDRIRLNGRTVYFCIRGVEKTRETAAGERVAGKDEAPCVILMKLLFWFFSHDNALL